MPLRYGDISRLVVEAITYKDYRCRLPESANRQDQIYRGIAFQRVGIRRRRYNDEPVTGRLNQS